MGREWVTDAGALRLWSQFLPALTVSALVDIASIASGGQSRRRLGRRPLLAPDARSLEPNRGVDQDCGWVRSARSHLAIDNRRQEAIAVARHVIGSSGIPEQPFIEDYRMRVDRAINATRTTAVDMARYHTVRETAAAF